MFAALTFTLGLPQLVATIVGLVLALASRRRAPRAFRLVLAASVAALLLVGGDLVLLSVADLRRSLTYATEQRLDTVSQLLTLLATLTLVPLLLAVVAGRGLRLPPLPGRRARPPVPRVPPPARSRWEQVLPPQAANLPPVKPPRKPWPPGPPS